MKGSLTRVAAVLVMAVPALAAPATASASSGDPVANRHLSDATLSSCAANPAGSACINSALAGINAAHAAEHVPAMVLPSNFASMSVPVQLLNLANRERVERGLTPILGLSANLDQDAQAAAARDRDPMATHFYGDMMTSNWAGGDGSSLEADFEWMYDDGLGSGNLDCTRPDASGCWGHRHDILWHFANPIAMGAGYGTGQYGPSMTELFVGGDTRTGAGQPDAPIVKPDDGGTAVASNGHRPPVARVVSLFSAGSRVRLTVGCVSTAGAPCRLTVSLGLGRAGHQRSVGTAAITVRAGHSRTVTISPDRAAMKLLGVRHQLRVRVTLRQPGGRVVLSRSVTLTK